VSFAVFLLFSIVFVQVETNALTESKKSALVNTLSHAQLGLGAFHFFENITGTDYYNEGGTSQALITLSVLDMLSHVDVDKAVTYLASRQDNNSGGFGAFYGYDGTLLGFDLRFTYDVVHALKVLNSLDRINTTAVVNFVLARYNHSIGAFGELLTEAYGKKYAMSRFVLGFRTWNAEMAYAIPNVITTYLSVSILADLEMLRLINETKTFEWLMSCQASNGAFQPYPMASPTYLPGWSSLITNPFDVDRYGTGVPYTFAAVEALKNLGRLSDLDSSDRERIRQYLLSSQAVNGNFYIHPDYERLQLAYTYYAVTTLSDIGTLKETEDGVLKAVSHLQQVQLLAVDNSFPLPQTSYAYGLFHDTSTDPLEDTTYAVAILNVTSNLALLDQPTPKTLQTWPNLLIISALVAGSVASSSFIFARLKKRRQNREQNEASKTENSETVQTTT
jgi:prenyltransferase beta subunit